MASKIGLASLGALALVIAGCSNASGPRSLYYWDGTYSSSLYSYLNEDGDATEQISRLENLVQNSTQRGYKVAPGLYAHLGLLYLNNGNLGVANANFDKEVQNFPESREYINFIKGSRNLVQAPKTEEAKDEK
jgi:tetratricopeptide repeat protein